MALVALGFAPWLLILARQTVAQWAGLAVDLAGTPRGALLGLAYAVYAWLLGDTIFPWHPAALPGLAAGVALVSLGLGHLRRREVLGEILLPLAVPLAATVATINLVATTKSFVTVPSRALVAVPFLCLLLAGGCREAARRGWAWRVALACFCLAWAAALANYHAGRQFLNPIYLTPARELAQHVGERLEPGDVVMSDEDTGLSVYYRRAGHSAPHVFAHPPEHAIRALESAPPRRVWLVTLERDSTRHLTPVRLIAWLETRYRLVETRGFGEQDATYHRLKETLLGRPGAGHRATVRLYAAAPG
jgi:hypothetical protein